MGGTDYIRRDPRRVVPPLRTMPGLVNANFVKDPVPLGTFDISAKIVIENFPTAAVAAANSQ